MNYSNFHLSQVEMTTFNGRACTMYNSLPNICPDFIYLDGPDQFKIKAKKSKSFANLSENPKFQNLIS